MNIPVFVHFKMVEHYLGMCSTRVIVDRHQTIGTASGNSVESDLGCTSSVYFNNVTMTSKKPCQHNDKFDCSEINGYSRRNDNAINEV